MKCPYCNAPMEKGKIYAAARYAPVVWLPEPETLKWYYSQSKLERQNGLRLAKPELSIEPTCLPAYICKNCKKGVFEF